MSARLWMLAQPLIAVLALSGFTAALLLQLADRTDLIPSVQALITATFVYPGLALSMLVNHAIVRAREPRVLTSLEKLLVVGQLGVAGLLALTSLEPEALLLGFLLWPLLIVAAVTACWTMTATTVRNRREHRRPLDGVDSDRSFDDHADSGGVATVSPVG